MDEAWLWAIGFGVAAWTLAILFARYPKHWAIQLLAGFFGVIIIGVVVVAAAAFLYLLAA